MENTPFFFIHIPKTAGTSFWKTLVENYDNNQIFPNDKIIRVNKGAYPSIQDIRKNKYKKHYIGKSLFYGHYPLYTMKFFPRHEYAFMTFFRDPVERTISHLKHIKLHNSNYSMLSLKEIFEHRELRISQFDNLQTRYFLKGNPSFLLRYNNLKVVKRTIKGLFFIGISEEFEKSISNLEAKMNINLNVRKDNVFQKKIGSQTESNFNIDEELIFKIYKANIYDIELYNFARDLSKVD